MARRPHVSTDVDPVVKNPSRTAKSSDEKGSIDEQTDGEGENGLNADVHEDDTLLSDLAVPPVNVDVRTLAGSNPASRDVYTTTARDGLSLRAGPGPEFPIIRSLPFGTRVHLPKREGRWGLVDIQGDGATDGFVHSAFLSQPASVVVAAETIPADQVRAFWAGRNPRGALLYDRYGNPLVDPRLLHASAVGTTRLEGDSPNYRIEMYGPNGGFRTGGSTANHGAQPGTRIGAAMDFVIIDRGTGNMLTNHPGAEHQHQGTVGGNAPWYQSYFNEVVRAGAQLYRDFAEMARFGGYFANSNPMDTMHIDLRGKVAPMGGGSLRGGFTGEQMRRWQIPENRPYR